jgi:hypothetical protein
MDFLADQVDCLGIGDQDHPDTLGRKGFQLTGWPVATVTKLVITALESAALAILSAEIARFPAPRAIPRWTAPALAAIPGFPAGRSIIRLGFGPACGLGLAASGARPRRAERETCQQAAQWVFFGIAHGDHRRVSIRK